MSPTPEVRILPAPSPTRGTRSLWRWVCTNNPFYVLSAGLFFVGLYISFGTQAEAADTWALMGGLGSYTLLLAATACLLVRSGNVWDDVRTVLLLAVLMFLATSVTFDEVLVFNPTRGIICYLVGLLFAIAVSEGVLRGIRLRLPAWYRGPYYLILALFFLYPLALRPLVDNPQGEALAWGLFGFSPTAGLILLTLLPAVRRGPDYVRGNGSPWPWPLYPWVLFGLLAAAVPARAFLLCWSMQLLNNGNLHHLLFGPFFLVPFGLAVAVLLLEAGLVAHNRALLHTALVVPLALVFLLLAGHRDDPIYRGFLDTFAARTGIEALAATLLAAAGFYAYAGLRGVGWAAEWATAALVALAFVGPETLEGDGLILPRAVPLLAAAALQLALGLLQRETWRCLLGALGLAAVAVLALPEHDAALRGPLAFHLILLAVLALGAAFDDALARGLRTVGAGLVLLACLAVAFGAFDEAADRFLWVLALYPLFLGSILAGYGWLLRHRPALAGATLTLGCWLGVVGWRGYRVLRELIAGLDQLALSLALFAVAVLISLGKSGALGRWTAARRGRVSYASGLTEGIPPAHGVWRQEDRVSPEAETEDS